MDIFIKIKPKNDKGLDFLNWVFNGLLIKYPFFLNANLWVKNAKNGIKLLIK